MSTERDTHSARLSTMHDVLVMVLADGKVTDEERRHIERVRDRLGIPAEQFKQLCREIKDGARQIRLPASTVEAHQVLRELIDASLADGQIDPAERRVLEKVAAHMKLAESVLAGMLDEAAGTHEREIQDKIEAIYLHFVQWSAQERKDRLAELERFGRPAVVPLLEMLESYRTPDGVADTLEMKVIIVDTLAALGDRRAVYYLATQVALSDTSEVTNDALRAAAAEAIGRLIGKPFARDAVGVAAAREWWKGAGTTEYNTLAM